MEERMAKEGHGFEIGGERKDYEILGIFLSFN